MSTDYATFLSAFIYTYNTTESATFATAIITTYFFSISAAYYATYYASKCSAFV